MLVSHKHRFILIKTHKTAGTSVEGLLEPFCVPDGHTVRQIVDELVTDAGIVAARAGGKSYKGYTAHMTAREISDALSPKVFDAYTKIVPVRDPFDKVVSWYWHVMPHPTKDRVGEDFDVARTLFLDWIKMRPTLNTDVQFYTVKKRTFPCVLVRYENLADEIVSLSKAIGVPLDPESLPTWKSRTRRHKERVSADYYDIEAADLVRSKFAFDFENFGYDPNRVCPS